MTTPADILAATTRRRIRFLQDELSRRDVRSVPEIANRYRLEIAALQGDRSALAQLKELQ